MVIHNPNSIFNIRNLVDEITRARLEAERKYKAGQPEDWMDMLEKIAVLDEKLKLVLHRIYTEGNLDVTKEADLHISELLEWVQRCMSLPVNHIQGSGGRYGYFSGPLQKIRMFMQYPQTIPYVEPERLTTEWFEELYAIKGYWCIPSNIRAWIESGKEGIEYAKVRADAYGNAYNFDCDEPENLVIPVQERTAPPITQPEVADDPPPAPPPPPPVQDNTALIAKMRAWRNDPKWKHHRTHTDRWDSALLALGETVTSDGTTLRAMTWQKAKSFADKGWGRWVDVWPAIKAITAPAVMQAQSDTTDDEKQKQEWDTLIKRMYNWRNDPHAQGDALYTKRWDRALLALGEDVADKSLTPMTWEEARSYANKGWSRWHGVYLAIKLPHIWNN